MRYNQVCPKCQSEQIMRISGASGKNTSNIAFGIFGTIHIDRMVCGQCGYTEEWIDPSDMDFVKSKFGK